MNMGYPITENILPLAITGFDKLPFPGGHEFLSFGPLISRFFLNWIVRKARKLNARLS